MRTKIVSADEFITLQERSGVFSGGTVAPENDPRVLRAYLSLLRDYYPDEASFGVRLYAGRYGFFRDPVDDARDGLNWAMTTPVIDMCIGVFFDEFVRDIPAIAAQADKAILTDSFSFADGFGRKTDGLIFLNSPVAEITMPFNPYLESLTSERRKKYRRMAADFDKTSLTFTLSKDGMTANEIAFIHDNLRRKWGEDAGYAFRQTLWFLAVQSVRPEQCLVMRVTDRGAPVFFQTMIIKNDRVTCQSIAKNEDQFYSGIAAFTDFKCVEALCGASAYRIFDPSCRTSLSDPESIGVAKRATVNRNCVKPLLAIGPDLPDNARNILTSGAVQGLEA